MALAFYRAARKLHRLSPPSAALSLLPSFPSPRPIPNLLYPSHVFGSPIPPWRRRPWNGSPLIDGFHHRLSLASMSGASRPVEGEGDAPHQDRVSVAAAPAQPSWVDVYLPASVRPYALLARLDKPIGTWLLAWPCMWYCLL